MENPEIPLVDLPDEIGPTNLPEIGETTWHPLTPGEEVPEDPEETEGQARPIGFNV